MIVTLVIANDRGMAGLELLNMLKMKTLALVKDSLAMT